ncbi:MAG: hypothetical protein K0S46_506 [Moraxellaceae bacterium]|jgi:hypothetical protein|nr:hypothetical protein [Moraxellaceae bacterium]
MTAPHPFLPLIAETLAATAADSIVAIGELPWPEGAVAPARRAVAEVSGMAGQMERAGLAVAMLPAGMEQRDARQLIAALRDLLARQLLVFVPESLLDDTALLGLALTRQARFELDGTPWQAWSYDIRTYKSVPDWLNPKFWANPENWDRFRW